jgi:hypothetical protein
MVGQCFPLESKLYRLEVRTAFDQRSEASDEWDVQRVGVGGRKDVSILNRALKPSGR